MHWAIWQQLKFPPKGFEDIIRTHFRQRKDHVSSWLSSGAPGLNMITPQVHVGGG